MQNYLTINYKGMEVKCSEPYLKEYPNDKKEVIIKMDAFDKENNHRGGWDFVIMRSDPHNPQEKTYISNHKQIIQSGHDLIDRILSHI